MPLAGLTDLVKINFASGADGNDDFAFVRPPSKNSSDKINNGVWLVNLHGHGRQKLTLHICGNPGRRT